MGTKKSADQRPASSAEPGRRGRREFLAKASLAVVGAATLASCTEDQREAFFQRHFHELSEGERRAVIERHQRHYKDLYDADVDIGVQPPEEGVELAYALDLGRCIGCRRCEEACARENNCSRDPQIHWIRVLELEKDVGVDVFHAEHFYDHDLVPQKGHFYMPVACQQCRNPPCVKVCPVGATWTEADGITVIDYDWCIGCRYCMAACPYGARHFNWTQGSVPSEDRDPDREWDRNTIMPPNRINTSTHLLGNRPRPSGVVEKCTFCIHRTRDGRYPACVEACPVGARKFGSLTDEDGEIRYILEHKRVFILKEELNTQPRFYYFYG